MKVALEHTFAGLTADAYVDLFFDERFNVELGRAINLGRRVVLFERSATRIRRHLHCEPIQPKESLVTKVFGGRSASFEEEMDYDIAARQGRFRTIPSAFTDKVTIEGTLGIRESKAGVVRRVEGSVKVAIFGVGGLAERNIVAEIEGSYERAAAFTRSWIARDPVL